MSEASLNRNDKFLDALDITLVEYSSILKLVINRAYPLRHFSGNGEGHHDYDSTFCLLIGHSYGSQELLQMMKAFTKYAI